MDWHRTGSANNEYNSPNAFAMDEGRENGKVFQRLLSKRCREYLHLGPLSP